MKKNYQDAESYWINIQDMKKAREKYMWVCKCKTKNMKVNEFCYNCGRIR